MGLTLSPGTHITKSLLGILPYRKWKWEQQGELCWRVTWWECLSFLTKGSWHHCLALQISKGRQDHILCLIICLASVSPFTHSSPSIRGGLHRHNPQYFKIKLLCDLGKFSRQFFLNHVIVERKYETSLLILPVTLITQITEWHPFNGWKEPLQFGFKGVSKLLVFPFHIWRVNTPQKLRKLCWVGLTMWSK